MWMISSVNATARDFHGFTSAMSYARLVLSSAAVEDMPQFSTNALPPRYLATPLIQHYLDKVFVMIPCLSETALFASACAVYQNAGRHAGPFDHWTVRMVLAIALLSQSRQRGDSKYQDAVRHTAAALEKAEGVLHPGSVLGIQALLLLVQIAMLDPHHFNCWYLIGMASRAMVDLGLHQDPPEHLQTREVDWRRRVYYCVYTLDRFAFQLLLHPRPHYMYAESGMPGLSVWSKNAHFRSPTIPLTLLYPLHQIQQWHPTQLEGTSSSFKH